MRNINVNALLDNLENVVEIDEETMELSAVAIELPEGVDISGSSIKLVDIDIIDKLLKPVDEKISLVECSNLEYVLRKVIPSIRLVSNLKSIRGKRIYDEEDLF